MTRSQRATFVDLASVYGDKASSSLSHVSQPIVVSPISRTSFRTLHPTDRHYQHQHSISQSSTTLSHNSLPFTRVCEREKNHYDDYSQLHRSNTMDRLELSVSKAHSPRKGLICLTAFENEITRPFDFYPLSQRRGNVPAYPFHPQINKSSQMNKNRKIIKKSSTSIGENHNNNNNNNNGIDYRGKMASLHRYQPESVALLGRQVTFSEITHCADNFVTFTSANDKVKQRTDALPSMHRLERELTNLESAYIRNPYSY